MLMGTKNLLAFQRHLMQKHKQPLFTRKNERRFCYANAPHSFLARILADLILFELQVEDWLNSLSTRDENS